MKLDSPFFIFSVLPLLFLLYLIPIKTVKKTILFLSGLLFYAWLDPLYFPFVFIYILINFALGNLLTVKKSPILFRLVIACNVLILLAFKIIENPKINSVLVNKIPLFPDHTPTGFSFLLFTTLAFLVDSYMGRAKNKITFWDFSIYQFFFPKIIAGPIIRISQIKENFNFQLDVTSQGFRRFVIGLGKKILIANTLGTVVDQVFSLDSNIISTKLAWTAILFYTLQIYYDFSGYTDMAIGLGNVFGLELPENFNFPYISQGIGEFWRRWHITLSNWFRDYLFFPLERKRRGKKNWSQHINVLIVFFATGLWHGFSLNFVIWGLIHGVVITFENSNIIGGWIKKMPAILKHFYTLIVIIFSWVFFRSENFLWALSYLKSMIIFTPTEPIPFVQLENIQNFTWIIFIIGAIAAIKPQSLLEKTMPEKIKQNPIILHGLSISGDLILLILFTFTIITSFGRDSVSFIYGNF